MATTSIWAVKKRLDHVIDYTTNPDKTSKEDYKDLHNVIEYATASYKTEEQLYVTAINCNENSIYEDMMLTKRRFNKTDGILGFHAFQSFAEGEVTPEVAHEIGIKLANELWGDRFEVVVSTHINTNHIHNHFCINSVSFIDGKKYYNNRHTYALMRQTSDSLCREYNLSVIEEKPCGKHNIDYTKYYNEQVKKSNYYSNIKDDIDYAIGQAYNYIDFLGIMKKMNYEVIDRSGKLSVRPINRKRNIRIERAFGEDYTIKNINERIFNTQSVRVPFPEVRTLSGRYKRYSRNKKIRNKRKMTGIRALYFHYCYLLKIYPRKTKKIMSKELREEIKKMESISNEARFLCKTGIQTSQELLSYKSSSITKKNELKSKREYQWRKYKRAKTDEEKQKIKENINEITKEIEELSKTEKMIENIESRIPKMKENIQEMEEKETKKIQEIEQNKSERREKIECIK